jgi:hypothetical protein
VFPVVALVSGQSVVDLVCHEPIVT